MVASDESSNSTVRGSIRSWPNMQPGRRPGSASGRRREAPPRHQRLSTEDRWHPVAAVGMVASTSAGVVRRPHEPVRGDRRVRCGRALPHRAHARARPAAASVHGAPGERSGPRRRCRLRRHRPRRPARADRAVAGSSLRPDPARRRGDGAGPTARCETGPRLHPASSPQDHRCRRLPGSGGRARRRT